MSRTALLRPRRRGKHAKPSQVAHLAPAVLLTVPALAGAGLAASSARASVGTASTAAASLSSRAVAAPTPTTTTVSAPREQDRPVPVLTKATPRATAPARRPAPVKATAVAPRRESERASRSGTRTAWVSPLSGRLTSTYGPRWGRQHAGIDVAAPIGQLVRAASSGTVVFADWAGSYGNLVRIQHADGSVTAYAHMSRLLTSRGRVVAGEAIGRVGSTGRSTGPHLHFEVRVQDRPLNPVAWLSRKGASL